MEDGHGAVGVEEVVRGVMIDSAQVIVSKSSSHISQVAHRRAGAVVERSSGNMFKEAHTLLCKELLLLSNLLPGNICCPSLYIPRPSQDRKSFLPCYSLS